MTGRYQLFLRAPVSLGLALALGLATPAVAATMGNPAESRPAASMPTVSPPVPNSVGVDAPAAVLQQDSLPDSSYITLSGTVANITDGDEFTLNYGKGQIKVDTNDNWHTLFKADANNAANALKVGDRVTVTGRIDNNWFGSREIEAYALRHQNGTQIFNYEPVKTFANAPRLGETAMDRDGMMRLTGTIASVTASNRYEIYATDGSPIKVDARSANTTRAFRVGERVTVSGELDDNFIGQRTLKAASLQPASEQPPQLSRNVTPSQANEAVRDLNQALPGMPAAR